MPFPEAHIIITRKVRYFTLGFILLFTISTLGNILLQRKATHLTQEKNTQFLIAEKETSERLSVLKELDAVKIELQILQHSNDDLDNKLEEKSFLVSSLEQKNHRSEFEPNSKYASNEDLKSLRNEKQVLLKKINDLERQLRWQNDKLSDLQNRIDLLPDDIGEKIQRAKMIRATNILIKSSKLLRQFSVEPTLKGKLIKSICVDFMLLENYFAEQGEKSVSMTLTKINEPSAPKYNDLLSNTTLNKVIFNGSDTQVKIKADVNKSLAPGNYLLELRVEDEVAGRKEIVFN